MDLGFVVTVVSALKDVFYALRANTIETQSAFYALMIILTSGIAESDPPWKERKSSSQYFWHAQAEQ